MRKNRYEVVRQDNGQRLWYVWDLKKNETVNDGMGETIYFDSYQEAKEECDELNYCDEEEQSIFLSVELFKKSGKQFVHISEEGSSGAEYPVKDLSKVGTIVQEYVNTYCK